MIKILPRALLIGYALLQGCGAASFPAQKPTLDVTGNWQGTSVTACGVMLLEQGRCNAVQRISFSLFQDGTKLTGVYKCSVGTMVCQNMNEGGPVVASTLEGSLARIRVELPDGSTCIFNGNFKTESVAGGFGCYQGGGLLEQGRWQATRLF
jgi:hypothetical protein